MSLFEFVLVMASLVLAIGVTHLLHGVAAIIRHRASIEIDWIPLAWTGTVYVMVASFWWALWDFRSLDWTFPAFFYVMVCPTVLYMAMSLLLPENIAESREPLGTAFEKIRVPFMLFMALFLVLVTWDGWLLADEEFWNSLRWGQVAMLGVLTLAASTSSRRVQKATAVAGFLLASFGVFVLRYLPGAFGPAVS